MLINIRLSDGMLEIVEPGFDARAWRSPPNEKAFIVFVKCENMAYEVYVMMQQNTQNMNK